MIRPLFLIGNKRSGTSQLVRVLNLHPQVFVSHESDVVWILFQFHAKKAATYTGHPWDSEKGMRDTLERTGHLLKPDRTPWENFLAVEKHLMEKGTPWLPAVEKPQLRWLGDKKPFQHADPQLLPFIHEHFPEAHFLHIVRHPFAVAASSDRFNKTANGDFWVGLSPEEKVEKWTFYEEQVQSLRQKMGDRVHSLRYEDLCADPQRELSSVFKFLKLDPDPQALAEAAKQTLPAANVHPSIACSDDTVRMAEKYRYDVARPTSRLRVARERIYSWAVKRHIR